MVMDGQFADSCCVAWRGAAVEPLPSDGEQRYDPIPFSAKR